MVDKVLFSKATDDWLTPDDIINPLRKEFNFVLDAATNSENTLGMPEFYTMEDNGLALDWKTWTFCNPPYSLKHDFVAKAYYEFIDNKVSSVLLLPNNTHNVFFHMYIWDGIKNRPKKGVEIRFLKGKRIFKPYGHAVLSTRNTAPFGSMIIIFRASK